MAAEFAPSTYSRLKRRLQDLVTSSSNIKSNEWYVEVDRIRSTFVDLGRVKGMNDQDKKEIEGGTLTRDGERSSIGTDYIQQSLLLSKSLRVSEHYAATLLSEGLHNRAKLGRNGVEASCIVYHRERQDLLACIKLLVYNSIELRHHQSDPNRRDLGNKMATLLDAMLEMEVEVGHGVSRKKGKMVDRILEEIDALRERSDQVQAELRGVFTSQQPLQQPFGVTQHPNQQTQAPRLSDEIQLIRLRFIHQERRDLGTILYLLAFGRMLPSQGIAAIVKWLSSVKVENGSDALVTYILVALLAALDPTPDVALVPSSSRSSARSDLSRLFEDRGFVSLLNAEITSKAWTIATLKSTAVLQWTLFLSEALRSNPGLGTELRLSPHGIQNLVIESIAGGGTGPNALKGDALVYLNLHVLAFRNKAFDSYDGEDDDMGEGEIITPSQDAASPEQEIDPEFQAYILAQVQNLVSELTSTMLPFIRKLQRAEEDASFASSRGRVGSGSRDGAAASSSRDRRYDIEALFDLVTLLCRGRPDTGLHFWLGPDDRTSRFLRWAIDVREQGHQRALLGMLAALATGDASAWHAHALLASADEVGGDDGRLVSWNNLFNWMQHYIEALRPANASSTVATSASSRSAAGTSTLAIPPEEVLLLRSFLRLLKNVVYFSPAARSAIYENVQYSAINRLFSLHSVYAPVELKGAILEALAAFAHPTASLDAAGRAETAKIVSNLWSMLEISQALGSPAPSHSRAFASSSQGSGVYSELESIEAPSRSYPGSTAFIKLLTSLVLIPPRPSDTASLLHSSTALASTSTTPGGRGSLGLVLNLGQAHRSPGIEPYVNFVIDGVLLQAGQREYANQAERWKITSSCLEFLERCLTSYDMSSLLAVEANGSPDVGELASLLLHPGFTVMRKLLIGSKLLDEVLGVLAPGASNPSITDATFELIDSDRANTVFFKTSVKHALRIVQRVLRIQDIFLQVLLPYLSEAANAGVQMPVDVRSKVGSVGGYSSLDSHLLHHWPAVVQIALFINCEQDDIALLSVRVLGLVAKSPSFAGEERFEHARHKKMNRLLGLLDMSDEADRVRAGFVAKLERGGMSDEASVELAVQSLANLAAEEDDIFAEGSELVSAEVDGLASAPENATEALRLVILNFLIANTASSLPAPNIAHLILGYDLRNTRPEEQTLPSQDAHDAAPSAFHSIMDLLSLETEDEETPTLVESSPALAEKCFTLLQNLCVHPFTSVATLRFLRTGANFFTDQLCALPIAPVESSSDENLGFSAFGRLVFAGGRAVDTSVDAVVASLRTRALILDGVALELHSLINAGMNSRAAQLISVLCGPGNGGALDGLMTEDARADRFIADGEDFNREPFSNGTLRILEALTSLDFEWQDSRESRTSGLHLLANLDVTQAQLPAADASVRAYNINAILNIITHARYNLHKNGQLSDQNRRTAFQREAEIILNWASAQNASRAISLARQAALESWRHVLDMILTRSVHLIRPDFRATTLSEILQILLPRLVTRGPDLALSDLYSAAVLSLLTALRQCKASIGGEAQIGSLEALSIDKLVGTLRQLVDAILLNGISGDARGNLYSALVNFLQLVGAGSQEQEENWTGANDDAVSVSSYAGTQAGSTSILESRTASLLLSQADRLIPLVAKDALDGRDVWRLVAFTLLDKLCSLEIGTSSRKSPVKSLELLSRPGFLQSFVASLRDMDLALQDVVRPDPSSLNFLYVYESMFAFFNRLTHSRGGAERLLDSKIFDVLSQADYLASRPDQDHDFIDLDSFLPVATERYNNLLTPALQLCVGILSSVNSRGPSSSSRKAINDFSPSANAAPRQALAFLNAHRDTLLHVLKSAAAETTSIAAVEQARLLVSTLSFVLPILDDDALSPPNAFSAFHSSALSLAASFLHPSAWQERLVPHTEIEREADAVATSLSVGGPRATEEMETDTRETLFDVQATKAVSRLDAALLRYLESSSETHAHASSASKIRPVFTPTISVINNTRSHTPFEEEGRRSVAPSRSYSSPIPSLGAALSSLDHNTLSVLKEIQSLEEIEAMLAKPDGFRLDEWDEIARAALGAEDLPVDVGPAQRRRLALGELSRRRSESRINMVIRLDAIEILLVLLFRHFNYYLSLSSRFSGPSNNYDLMSNDPFLRGSRQRGLEALSNGRGISLTTGEAVSLGQEAVESVNGALERLQQLVDAIASGQAGLASLNHGSVSASAGSLVPHASERIAFVEMAGRKLQETMSLVEAGNGGYE